MRKLLPLLPLMAIREDVFGQTLENVTYQKWSERRSLNFPHDERSDAIRLWLSLRLVVFETLPPNLGGPHADEGDRGAGLLAPCMNSPDASEAPECPIMSPDTLLGRLGQRQAKVHDGPIELNEFVAEQMTLARSLQARQK